MESIGCIFCKNQETDARIVVEENGFTGRKCPQCGLIYISPRPTATEIIDIYGHNEAYASAESHIKKSFGKRLHARHSLSILKRYKKQGALLELGAGAGYFLEEAKKEGFDVYGVELNPIQVDFIKQTFDIPCEKKALKDSYDQMTFDVIYHCDVISHFHDPISEFREMHNRLNAGGIVLFETGNLGDVEEKYLSKIPSFHYPDHLFFYSRENIERLLNVTGFKLITVKRYSITYQKILRLLRRVIRLLQKITNVFGVKISENILIYFRYLLRYKLGYILPKNRKPQTVIVVAEKLKSNSRN